MSASSGPSTTDEVRVAFWNTWLLAPRLWRTGPRVPGMQGWFAPDVAERAPLVGRAVAGRFDLAALGECFERSEQEAVAAAWPEAQLVAGPQRRGVKPTGSGLATLVGPRVVLERSAQHVFRAGGDLRDSDTFAAKGALLTRIRVSPGGPAVEVVSTHLLAGGDLFPLPGAEDSARHHVARMAQVDELLAFVDREHDPAAVLLVVGDFNVEAVDPDPRLADPAERYRDLSARMEAADLHDLWPSHGVGHGATCTFSDPAELTPDPAEPDRVLDDPAIEVAPGRSQRIDYLWLRTPRADVVEVERPRRWAFSGRAARGGPAGTLSDHLAISVTLRIDRSGAS